MSVTIGGADLKNWTHKEQRVKQWVHEGVTVWKAETDPATLSVSLAQAASAVSAYSAEIPIPDGFTEVVFTAYSHPTIFGTVESSVYIDGVKQNARKSIYNGAGQSYIGSEITLDTAYACGASIKLYLFLERDNNVSDMTREMTFSVIYYFK